jgi:quercetin dioxygenase-like cupin family protein
MTTFKPTPVAIHIDDVVPVEVALGITRRNLTSTAHARGWLIDFAPGTTWPSVDHHATEERYYVLDGEVIDGDATYPAGTYVTFAPGSSHQPHTTTGARMLGLNLAARDETSRS